MRPPDRIYDLFGSPESCEVRERDREFFPSGWEVRARDALRAHLISFDDIATLASLPMLAALLSTPCLKKVEEYGGTEVVNAKTIALSFHLNKKDPLLLKLISEFEAKSAPETQNETFYQTFLDGLGDPSIAGNPTKEESQILNHTQELSTKESGAQIQSVSPDASNLKTSHHEREAFTKEQSATFCK